MKHWTYFFAGFVVIAVAVLLANLLTLKIAADQVSSQVGSNPLIGLLGSFGKKS